jgi:hypothetical protein
MSRIEWTRLSGEDVETVVGVFLCREFPRARRIRPSAGDGGIDVLVPVEEGWDVYQVKRYATNLGSSEKRAIERSLGRLMTTIETEGLVVKTWHLTLPLNPTPENSRWLDDITADAPFQAQWKGFDHVEGWAARYPDVVDYYLGNGKELLNQNIQALLTILRRRQDPGDCGSLRPSDISGDLLSLDRALNSHDPHYRYEFRVSVDPPPLIEEPRLIAVQQERLDGRWTTYWLFCRYDDAISDRPPPTIQLRFAAEPGSELHQQLADMATYGTPLQAATASFSADLPGGLGGHFDEGAVTIGPAHPVGAQPYVIRLVLVDPQGHELAAVRCDMQPITQGFTGEGSRAWGQETNGVFAVELRINQPTERATINIRTLDVSGKAPHDVVGGLRWLRAFRPPNALKVGPPHGPAPSQGLPIPDHGDLEVEALLAVAENLAVIQNYVTVQLMMPAEVTAEQFEAFRHAARLLKDQVMIGTWNSWAVTVGADASHDLDTEPGSMSSVMVVRPLVITLDGVDYELGQYRQVIESASIDRHPQPRSQDGQTTLTFIPGNSDRVRWELGGWPVDDGSTEREN